MPKEWQTEATQQSHFSVAASRSTAKSGSRTRTAPRSCGSTSRPASTRTSARSRNPKNGRPIGIYGIYADQQNNAYILEFGGGGIGKIDAKTGKLAFYPTPTPISRARRGRVDDENRLWFAEYGGNARRDVRPEDREDHRVEDAAAVGSAL